jgi:hypothetical protein
MRKDHFITKIKKTQLNKHSVTCTVFAWLIIMDSGRDDWAYWYFFTTTLNYDSSQSMTVYNSSHSLLDHEPLPFRCDEWRTKDSCSHLELPWTTFVWRMNPWRVWGLYYDRRSVGRFVFGIKHKFWAYDQILLLSDNCGLVNVGRSLWREDGSVVYNCCWPLPVQSFLGHSPVVFVTVFYCLRFETSLFFVSYDSQNYGGGVRPSLQETPRLVI